MEGDEDNEEDNTLMAGLDIAANTAMDILSEIEGSIEDEVLSYLSVDGGSSTLTSDNSINSSGGSRVAGVMTRRSTRIKTPKKTTTKAPRVGGSKDGISCTGGSFVDPSQIPKTIKAYCPTEFNFLSKVEEASTEGLAARHHLDVASNTKSTFTLMSWVKNVRIYMEERGLDSIFRIFNYKTGVETYMFDKWSVVRKPKQVELWIRQLNRGLKLSKTSRCPICQWNLENLQWSGKALENSVSNALWRLVERDLPAHATGPEVFKAIIMKWKHLSTSTIRTMVQELKTLKIVNVPGQDVNVLAEKLADKAGQIEGATENPPSDLAFLVATSFQSSTE